MKKHLSIFCFLFIIAATAQAQTTVPVQYQQLVDKLIKAQSPADVIPQQTESPNRLLEFAKSMLGIRYRTASSSPSRGFDCSGFVNYVFSNFGFKVPRSSREFATSGEDKSLAEAKIGDVILFTGTNSRSRTPGHVGIIYSINGDEVRFIHSSSGNAKGVTISSLDEGFYKKRFLKVVSIL
ncbi:C40 family peptidase [Pedobacter sp. MC2016-24]|uniref:C40 family peptidase n=1 Tax=Pedobacter sp. MC2016-24 TaxID=2780090 RepID=UPI001880AEE3|nr:C40 family peptidase [Pedobacter sp. MC2016-24]MBE9602098.1 C40 family peptidase [Pedobacter sp. MC2016-24]